MAVVLAGSWIWVGTTISGHGIAIAGDWYLNKNDRKEKG